MLNTCPVCVVQLKGGIAIPNNANDSLSLSMFFQRLRSTDSRVAVEGVILFGQVKHSDRGCARGSDIAQLTFKRWQQLKTLEGV